MGTPYKMKGMDFGNTPFKKDIKITTGFGPDADSNLSKKVNKSGSKSTRSFTKTAEAKKFLKRNTIKPKPFVKPKGVLGPGTRPLSPKVKKDISKVKNVAKNIGKKATKFLSASFPNPVLIFTSFSNGEFPKSIPFILNAVFIIVLKYYVVHA